MSLAEDGNFAAAIATLQDFLRGNPDHAGGWLDLAIFNCRLGKTEEKDNALTTLRRLGEHTPLPSVIDELLLRLRADTCTRQASDGSSQKTLRVSAGRAQNLNFGSSQAEIALPSAVTLRLDERMLPRSSDFFGGELAWQQRLPGELAGQRLSALFQAGTHSYVDAADYSTRNANLGLLARGRLGKFEGIHSLSYGNLHLGGHAYLETLGLRSHWQRLLLGDRLLAGGGLAYTRLAYAQNAFDGDLYEPGVYAVTGFHGKGIVRADWNLILDTAVRERPGGDRRGMAWSLATIYPTTANQRLEAHAKATRLDDSAPYLPALFGNLHRHSMQYLLSVANTWQLGRDQRLRFEWRFQQQDDTLPLFSYTARNLSLTWEYLLD